MNEWMEEKSESFELCTIQFTNSKWTNSPEKKINVHRVWTNLN
jgi:hypothetical protein